VEAAQAWMTYTVDETQQKAARVVGVLYLFAMATAMFAEGYVRSTLIDYNDAAVTARNIIAHKQLFRWGIAAELITYAADIALITALYVILAPINRHLALFAAFLRVVGETVGVMNAANSVDVLRVLSDADYLRAFEADQLAALARLYLGAHNSATSAVFVFLGLGSTVFGYLWFKSAYVPRAWGVLGVFASALLAAGALAFIVFPSLGTMLYPGYMVPMFFFEVGMGLWLLVRGLRPSPFAEPDQENFSRQL